MDKRGRISTVNITVVYSINLLDNLVANTQMISSKNCKNKGVFLYKTSNIQIEFHETISDLQTAKLKHNVTGESKK